MFNEVLSWQFGAVALLVMLGTAAVACRLLRIEIPRGRNGAIDGLRGYLAAGVFLHHATVLHFFVRGAGWNLPPPGVYRELGWNCVGLFFMITAYLFVGKLLDARRRPIDWLALFTSRVLRLTPLYVLAMVALFLVVGFQTGWQLAEPASVLVFKAWTWLAFSMMGAPDLNGFEMTSIFTAGVTWTLAYEWLFYLSLPLLAAALRVRVPPALVVVSVLALVLLALGKGAFFPLAFVKGALAAVVARQPRIAAWLRQPSLAPVIFAAAWVAVFVPPSAAGNLLVAGAFCLVACGNDAWGVLSNRAARALGDISYGVYLLHGLLLASVFVLGLGLPTAAGMTPFAHWSVVAGIGALAVLTGALSYRFVERPAMRQVGRVVASIRSVQRFALAARAPVSGG